MMFVLIGAGGHAKVILDILRDSHSQILGILDDNSNLQSLDGIPVLGNISDIPKILTNNTEVKFIISIGSNTVREKIVSKLQVYNLHYGSAIHPSAIIGSNVKIGEGTVVMANTVVNHSANIGSHAILNTASTIDHDCNIGNYVHVSPGANLAGNVKVGEGTHIGIGASLIQGIEIGKYSVVGAGSVVIKDINKYKVAVGCPALEIKDSKIN
jgi:acetyltransferase EpsM